MLIKNRLNLKAIYSFFAKLSLFALFILSNPSNASDTGAGVQYIPPTRNLGIGLMSPNEFLTINGHIALHENGTPAASSNYGKVFVNSTTDNLIFLDDSGNSFDLLASSSDINTNDGIWQNTGTLLRPENGDGAKTMVIGGTNNGNADIVIFKDGEAIFNKQANQVDFRIESQTGKSAYALYMNDDNGYIGLNSSTPTSRLFIQNGAITLGDYPGGSNPSVTGFNSVTWLSDGNSGGSNGDLMVKIATDSSTRLFTLVDFNNNKTPTFNGLTLTNLSPFRLVKANSNGNVVSEHDLIVTSSNNLGVGIQDATEKLTISDVLSLDEVSAPSGTAGYGKLYVKSTDSNLYFMDSAGTEVDLLSAVGVLDEWLDAGTYLHPRDNNGVEDVVIGATSIANADIELSQNGGAIFNKQSKSKNFRIEGTSDTNLFYANGTTNNIGIGLSNPSTKLEVSGTIKGINFNGSTANNTTSISSNTNSTNTTINGLSNGSILFIDINGELAENNSQFYWDRSSKELGLATSNTREKLTINGRLALSSLDSLSNSANFGKLYLKSTDSNLYFLDDSGAEKDLLAKSITLAINDLTDAKTNSTSVFLSKGSGENNSGDRNTAAGEDSLYTNTSGDDNSAMGHQALYLNSSGNQNTALGYEALKNSTASNNTAAGQQAALNNSTGANNLAIGNEALKFNQSGSNNTAIGYQSGFGANTFSFNNGTFLGYKSAFSNRTGDNNTFIGYQSGNGNSAGENNTYLGFKTGLLSNSNNNILLGAFAGDNITSGNNNLIIGYNNDASSASSSNQIDIADTIYGNSSNQNIGIGKDALNEKLTVNGSIALYELSSIPSNGTDFGKIYIKSSDHRLYYKDESNNEYDLTDNGQTGSYLVWEDTGTTLHPSSSNGDKTIIIGGSTSSNGDISLSHLGDADFNIQGKNINFKIKGESDNNLFFVNGSTSNIGIGLSNPNEKLTVEGELSLKEISTPAANSGYGKLYVDPSSSHLFFLDDSGIPYDIVAISNGGAATSEWVDNGSFLHPKDSSGSEGIIIGGTSPSSSAISINLDGSAVFNEQGDSVGFRVESNTDPNIIFVDGTNDRIGIGTSSPSFTLDINGDFTVTDYIYISNGIVHEGDTDTNIKFADSNEGIEFTVGNTSFINISNGATPTVSTGAVNLAINSSFNYINSSGYLGIKTNNPNEEITVNGVIALKHSSEPSNSTGFGKVYALSDGRVYYKDQSSGAGADLTCSGSNSEWTDGGDFIHPADNSGAEDLAIGSTYSTADTILYASGAARINRSNNSKDFRIEGNNCTHLFFAEGNTLSRIGIASSSLSQRLNLNGALALFEKSSTPSNATNYGKLFVSSVDSNLYFLDESGVQFNLTPKIGLWADGGDYIYPNLASGHKNIYHGHSGAGSEKVTLGANGDANFAYSIQIKHSKVGKHAFYADISNRVFIGGWGNSSNFAINSPSSSVDATISLREISTPSSTAGYGKLYVNSTNSLPYFIDNGGNTINLTNGTSIAALNDLDDAKTTSTSVYIGQNSGAADPSSGKSDYNVGIGGNSLQSLSNGDGNIAIGFNTLNGNTGRADTIGSIGIGFNALRSYDASKSTTSNGSNIAIGSNALLNTVNGALNIAIGNGALLNAKNAKRNIAIGSNALSALVTGNGNIAVGVGAGNNLTSGSNNIIIGEGNQAVSSSGSNQLDIGDIIYGDLSNNYMGINHSNPQRNLHVNGAILFTSKHSQPTSPALGDIYYDSSGTLCFYNGSAWVELADLPGSCS